MHISQELSPTEYNGACFWADMHKIVLQIFHAKNIPWKWTEFHIIENAL